MARLKLTAQLQEEICGYIAAGITKRGAAAAVGIDESSFFIWMQKAEEAIRESKSGKNDLIYINFFKAVKKAETAFKLTHIKNIKNAADEGQWQASAWLLERCYRDEYGKNKVEMEVTGKDGGAVETQSVVQIYLPENDRNNELRR